MKQLMITIILAFSLFSPALFCMQQIEQPPAKQFFQILPSDVWRYIMTFLKPSDRALLFLGRYVPINDYHARAIADLIEAKFLICSDEYLLALRALKLVGRRGSIPTPKLSAGTLVITSAEFLRVIENMRAIHVVDRTGNYLPPKEIVFLPFAHAKNTGSHKTIKGYIQKKTLRAEEFLAAAPGIMCQTAKQPAGQINLLHKYCADMLVRELSEVQCDEKLITQLKKYMVREGMGVLQLIYVVPEHFTDLQNEPEYKQLAAQLSEMAQHNPHKLRQICLALYKMVIGLNTYKVLLSKYRNPRLRLNDQPHTKLAVNIYALIPALSIISALGTGHPVWLLLNIVVLAHFCILAQYYIHIADLPYDLYEEVKDGSYLYILAAKNKFLSTYSSAEADNVYQSLNWPYHACDALLRTAQKALIDEKSKAHTV